MFIYNLAYTTNKFTKGKNTCEYIMLHHTWAWTFKSMMNYLAKNQAQVSCHYVIWEGGEIWRIGLDSYIMWHAWIWDKKYWKYINHRAIWIEVVSDWYKFTKQQVKSLTMLIKTLQNKYNIPTGNIIRHKDFTTRKWDIWDNFYKILGYSSYKEYLKREIDWQLVPEDNSVTEIPKIEQELKLQKIRNEKLRAENEELKDTIRDYRWHLLKLIKKLEK